MSYNFIHPTKCGGTAFSECIINNYPDDILCNDHSVLCSDTNDPIIIIREPIDRFLSMYKYWKHGSSKWEQDPEHIERCKQYSIKDYIQFIKTEDKDKLITFFTREEHYAPTVHWFNATKYENIIVIRYADDLSDKLNALLEYLGIENVHESVERVNVSYCDDGENIELDQDDIEFITTYFKDDFLLLEDIENAPEQFKYVI